MSQDLGQIILLIGAILGVGFALPFLMAWLEPQRTASPALAQQLPGRPRIRLVLARRILGPVEPPATDAVDAAA